MRAISEGAREMATEKQRAAARKNIKKAAAAARKKRTIANLPSQVRTALGKKEQPPRARNVLDSFLPRSTRTGVVRVRTSRTRVRARFSAIIFVTPAACAFLARIAAGRICVSESRKVAKKPQRSGRRTRSAARGKYRTPIPGDGTARRGRRADDPRDAAAADASDRRGHVNRAGS